MTNATVAQVVATPQGRSMTLKYKDGEKTVVVPDGVPIVTFKPGDRALLVAGAKVIVFMPRCATASRRRFAPWPGATASRRRCEPPEAALAMPAATLTAEGPPGSPARIADRHDRAFFGHPVGLGWLSFCELWERFSFYGMQALLVLYLTNYLFLPEHIGRVAGMEALRGFLERATGPMSPQQLASAVFGLYAGCVYLTPLFGGLLADRLLGRTKTVVIGASLMAIGHFLMAFEASFLIALAAC